ncbi:unnamed protein product, partial [Mesorhabditis spiculigera]
MERLRRPETPATLTAELAALDPQENRANRPENTLLHLENINLSAGNERAKGLEALNMYQPLQEEIPMDHEDLGEAIQQRLNQLHVVFLKAQLVMKKAVLLLVALMANKWLCIPQSRAFQQYERATRETGAALTILAKTMESLQFMVQTANRVLEANIRAQQLPGINRVELQVITIAAYQSPLIAAIEMNPAFNEVPEQEPNAAQPAAPPAAQPENELVRHMVDHLRLRDDEDSLIKLMPKYDGSPLRWAEFQSVVHQEIDQNARLTNLQKLAKLKKAVTGKPAADLEPFMLHEGQYQPAWDFLQARYGDAIKIQNALDAELKAIPEANESAESLRETLNKLKLLMVNMHNVIDAEHPAIRQGMEKLIPGKILVLVKREQANDNTTANFLTCLEKVVTGEEYIATMGKDKFQGYPADRTTLLCAEALTQLLNGTGMSDSDRGPLRDAGQNIGNRKIDTKAVIAVITGVGGAETRDLNRTVRGAGARTVVEMRLENIMIAEKTTPKSIQSDQQTSFVKAGQILSASAKREGPVDFRTALVREDIKWVHVVPRAPHANGAVERLVGLVKEGLKKALGQKVPSFTVFSTTLKEACYMVNLRPLVNFQDVVLRPADLLIARTHSVIDDPREFKPGEFNFIRAYLEVLERSNCFWQIFSTFYMAQNRLFNEVKPPNRRAVAALPSPGDVVMIRDFSRPKMDWRLGLVLELLKNRNDTPRSARIRLSNGHITERAISHLIPLISASTPEISENSATVVEEFQDPEDFTNGEPRATEGLEVEPTPDYSGPQFSPEENPQDPRDPATVGPVDHAPEGQLAMQLTQEEPLIQGDQSPQDMHEKKRGKRRGQSTQRLERSITIQPPGEGARAKGDRNPQGIQRQPRDPAPYDRCNEAPDGTRGEPENRKAESPTRETRQAAPTRGPSENYPEREPSQGRRQRRRERVNYRQLAFPKYGMFVITCFALISGRWVLRQW